MLLAGMVPSDGKQLTNTQVKAALMCISRTSEFPAVFQKKKGSVSFPIPFGLRLFW
jgi:hypothetical protein